MVKIDWTRPSQDGGAPIEQYKLEIASMNGSQLWKDITKFCPMSSLSRKMTCSFKQENLSHDDYKIAPGQKIVIRVSSKNQAGWSKAARSDKCSKDYQPVLALMSPPVLPKPIVT